MSSASSTLAVTWTVSPIDVMFTDSGARTMRFVRSWVETVTVTLADRAPEVTVTLVSPILWAVTTPWSSTEATSGSSLVQASSAPGSSVPPASSTLAESWIVSPIEDSWTVRDEAAMRSATCETATITLADKSSQVTVTGVCPFDCAVTTPWLSTEATAGSSLVQVRTGSWISISSASSTLAVTWTVSPIDVMFTDSGETTRRYAGSGRATFTLTLADTVPEVIVTRVSPCICAVTTP